MKAGENGRLNRYILYRQDMNFYIYIYVATKCARSLMFVYTLNPDQPHIVVVLATPQLPFLFHSLWIQCAIRN